MPRYPGNPLDPPLRSRFQARDVRGESYADVRDVLIASAPAVNSEKLSNVLSFASTLRAMSESSDASKSPDSVLPDFPEGAIIDLARILNHAPSASLDKLLHSLYPHKLIVSANGQKIVDDAYKRFQLKADSTTGYSLQGIAPHFANNDTSPDANMALVTLTHASAPSEHVSLVVPGGSASKPSWIADSDFVFTPSQSSLLVDMMLSHSQGDFCLVGQRGIGKSVLASHFAKSLGYVTIPIMLHRDMSARDLLQQRATLPNGDTTWINAPLIAAALEGRYARIKHPVLIALN